MGETSCSSAQIIASRTVVNIIYVITLYKNVPDKIHGHVSTCQMPNSKFH